MKKFLIALLMMAVVLVGVFADATSTGDATLVITTKINGIEPTFRLAAGTVYDDLGGDAGTLANAYVITTDELLNANQTVTFNVNQISKSRSVKTYTLSATATDLVLYQYPNAAGTGVVAVTTTAPHPADEQYKKFTVNSTTVNTFANGSLAAAKATYGGDATAKTITYLGNAQPATTDAPVTVATFTCTWKKNEDAVSGDYQATVTLTIASN